MSSLHYPILGTETYRFCCYSGVESATLLIIAILAIKKIIQGKNYLGPVPRYNNSSNVTMIPELNCKICLKSAGLYEFFDWFCVVLFEGKSSSKKCLNFDGLSMQETVGPIISSFVFSQQLKNFSCWSLKTSNHGKVCDSGDPDYSFFSIDIFSIDIFWGNLLAKSWIDFYFSTKIYRRMFCLLRLREEEWRDFCQIWM